MKKLDYDDEGNVVVIDDGKIVGEIKTIAYEIDKIAKEEERKTDG